MNHTPDSRDELISSYLDGEATANEVAQVESDPDLRVRADEMRAAIELTATPVTIPARALDQMRAAAVTAGTTTPVVSDLVAAAAIRQARIQRRNRLVSVAAAFVVLALGVGVIRSIGSSTDSETSGPAAGDDAAQGAVAETVEEAVAVETDLAEEAVAVETDLAEEAVAVETDLAEETIPAADLATATGSDSDRPRGLLAELCPLVVDEVLAAQQSDLVKIETARVEVDGFVGLVALALGPTGELTGFVVVDEDCEVVGQFTFPPG